jgi:23S rRNA pseudouridine1911/1915/1917 synthase
VLTHGVIYENEDVLVVNKPAGLTVHGDGRSKTESLVDWLEEHYPKIRGVGEPFVDEEGKEIVRSGIVHRLDKDTSGVMIVAKNNKTHQFLKSQFSERKVEKKYLAIVHGNFKVDGGRIDKPIGRSPKDYKLREATSRARGRVREALTDFKVLERFPSEKHLDDFSLLELQPKTGRTHQIRVHMKSISHPVAFDGLYARDRRKPHELGLARQALHASSLTLTLPGGERRTFDAPLPEDMKIALDKLQAR